MSMVSLFITVGLSWSAPIGNESEQAVIAALQSEMARSQELLSLPNAPPLYHMRYHVLGLTRGSVQASLGAMITEDTRPLNTFAVETRVGRPEFDNTGFVGWQNGFVRDGLPMQVTDFNVSQIAWWSTDRAYKQAVEQYARKSAQFTPPENYPGDYQLTDAIRAAGPDYALADFVALKRMAVDLSSRMRAAHGLEVGEVHLAVEQGRHLLVDSVGTVVRRPLSEITVRAVSHIRAPDGGLITDHRSWSVAEVAQLASVDEMEAAVDAMMVELEATRQAEPFEGEYVGPILFESGAAQDLFRYLLVPQLQGTPPEVPFESWFGELGATDDPVRVGRRVLPFGWSVVDNPRAQRGPGYFEYDLEGSPSRRVEAVQDGIIRTVLMSRIPRKGIDSTTGHARGYPGDRAVARVSQVTIEPDAMVSEKKLLKKALQAAESYGNDWIYVIRRLQDPAAMTAGADGWVMFEDGPMLPPPVVVYKVHQDGTETRVRGARFSSVSRWLLRDILAAGTQEDGVYLAPLSNDNYYSTPLEGYPTRIVAPSVLVGEMELVANPGDPREVRLLNEVPP